MKEKVYQPRQAPAPPFSAARDISQSSVVLFWPLSLSVRDGRQVIYGEMHQFEWRALNLQRFILCVVFV